MSNNLIDEATIRKFLTALHAHAGRALGDTEGVLHLSTLLPDAGSLCTRPFQVGDVEGMTQTAVAAAEVLAGTCLSGAHCHARATWRAWPGGCYACGVCPCRRSRQRHRKGRPCAQWGCVCDYRDKPQ